MKKILVLFTTAFVKTGGLTSVMMNYWRAMDKTGLSFDFASTNKIEDSLYEEILKEGCCYYQLPSRSQSFRYFRALRVLCSKGYDIIHVHANSATSVLELMAAKIARVPKRIHHNHTSRTSFPCLNRILCPLLRRIVTDAIACSDEAGEWLFGKGNYIVLPNAINVEEFAFNPKVRIFMRKELGIRENEFVVGHIGKFMDAKNHQFLIRAFAIYHTKYPHSKLLLVGDGALRSKIENWVTESGCSDAILLVGQRSDISAIVQTFDMFVFPSIYEGLPLSALEAQAAGLPCIISTNVTEAVVIGHDVLMKNLSDKAESWAEAFNFFDHTLPRKDRSVQNYELLTKAHFNIRTEANELRKLYNKWK